MMQRPFRFGVVAARAESGAAWVSLARRIEESGYSTLLMPDRLGGVLSPVPALAAAAAVTRSLRIGSFVLVGGLRSAAQVAHDAATLDFLSGGRFELGLGAGVSEEDFRRAGVPFESPRVRIARLGETIAAIKAIWSDQAEGGAQRYPAPVQKPRPPILIGASGKRLLALAAQEADSVSIGSIGAGKEALSEHALAERVEWLRQQAGERLPELELGVNLAAVVSDAPPSQQLRGRLRAFFAVEVEELVSIRSPFVVAGSAGEMCAQLLERRERFGISSITIADDLMEAFAPVVERLAGR